jgi:hypothetical protein
VKKAHLLALLLAAACGGLPLPALAAGQVVVVTLRDFRIDLPHTLPAGPVTFRVSNAGLADHNLEIRGQGVDTRLPQDLASGQHGTLRVNLRPGAYLARCPVPGHAEAGMQEKLRVR